MLVKLTKFSRTDGDKLLCKKMLLDEDGEIKKTSSANMNKGLFETVTVDFHEGFGDLLQDLTLDQALGLGVCQYGTDGEIVTRASDKENINKQIVCRTKDNFVWGEDHNLLFFDIDKNSSDIADIIAELYEVCPELSHTDLWAYPSAGSCVALDGKEVSAESVSGWHIYFTLKGNVSDFQQWLEIKLWNAGRGWIEVSKSGSMLKRALVDFAVFSPERLDFIAGSHCGTGVYQDRGDPIRINSGNLEPLSGTWEISSNEYNEYLGRVDRAKGRNENKAATAKKDYAGQLVASGKAVDIPTAVKMIESANEDSELFGSWFIILDDGKTVTVADILDSPHQFDGLTCSDPLEPDYGGGRCKAKIFWNLKGGNDIRITSFAHGGRQWLLKYDYKSLLDWVESDGVTPEKLTSTWKHKMTSKNCVVTPEEKADILKRVKRKMGNDVDLKTLKGILQKIEVEASMRDLQQEIEELNKQFAVLPIGNKVRILREYETIGFDGNKKIDFTIISKQDFLLLKQNRTVMMGDKIKPLAEIWLTSKERKEYKGIEFNPSVIGEYDGYYNPFKGFAIEPVEGNWALMKKHILEVICSGNEDWYNWLLDWCANCIQNPGGVRVGTAVVLIGGQGTGKGTFVNWFGKIFGQHFLPISSTRRLVGNFNSHLKDVILLFSDEAFWGGNVSEEGVLKQLITEDTIPIEPKGVDTFAVTNHVNLIMATNSEWAVPAGLDDRRFFVLKIDDSQAVNASYFKPLHKQMESGGLAAMMYELMEREITADLRLSPKTPALFKQKLQKMSYEEEFVYWMLYMNDTEVWGNFLSFDRLYEKFREHIQDSTHKPHQTKPAFSRRFESIAGELASRQRKSVGGARKWGMEFFDVYKARVVFEEKVGQGVEWLKLETEPDDV